MTMFWVIFGILFGIAGCSFFMYFKGKLRQINESIIHNSNDTFRNIDDLKDDITRRIDDEVHSIHQSIKVETRELDNRIDNLIADVYREIDVTRRDSEANMEGISRQIEEVYRHIEKSNVEIKALLDSRLDKLYNKVMHTFVATSNKQDIRFSDIK